MKPGVYYSTRFNGIIEITDDGYFGLIEDHKTKNTRFVLRTSWGSDTNEIKNNIRVSKKGYGLVFVGEVE
jgi:hypothetical protein